MLEDFMNFLEFYPNHTKLYVKMGGMGLQLKSMQLHAVMMQLSKSLCMMKLCFPCFS